MNWRFIAFLCCLLFLPVVALWIRPKAMSRIPLPRFFGPALLLVTIALPVLAGASFLMGEKGWDFLQGFIWGVFATSSLVMWALTRPVEDRAGESGEPATDAAGPGAVG